MKGSDRAKLRDQEAAKRVIMEEPLNSGKQSREDMILQIAKTAHEVNRAYCATIKEDQPSWDEAPDWQKESAVNGVKFHLENPEAGPEGSHENWMKVKEAEGWVYGKEKNPETKEHPCMVPYDKLPKKQQYKDSLFIAVVRSFHE